MSDETHTAQLQWFRVHAARMLEVAHHNDLDTVIGSCPGWSLGDLIGHTGRVFSMASGSIRAAQSGLDPSVRPSTIAPPADDSLVEWFDDRVADIDSQLSSLNPDALSWTFAGPAPASFWIRRMANETAIHRWDADTAVGVTCAFEPAHGIDLVDEFFDLYVPRIGAQNFADPDGRSLHFHATDGPGEWVIQRNADAAVVTREHGKSTTAVRGPASALALVVWSRSTADVEVFGDPDQVAEWQSRMYM